MTWKRLKAGLYRAETGQYIFRAGGHYTAWWLVCYDGDERYDHEHFTSFDDCKRYAEIIESGRRRPDGSRPQKEATR